MSTNKAFKFNSNLLFLFPLVALGLVACGDGSNSSGPNPDFQNFSSGNLESQYVITGTASLCRQIPVNGTCTVAISYLAESNSIYNNGPVSLVGLPTGYTSNASSTHFSNSMA